MITGMRSARRPERVSALRAYPDDAASGGLTKGSGYTIFSYLIAGMLAYGGIGWLIGRAVHVALLFPVGMLIGHSRLLAGDRLTVTAADSADDTPTNPA